jgi:hypothetical protein
MITITDSTQFIVFSFGENEHVSRIAKRNISSVKLYQDNVFIECPNENIIINYIDVSRMESAEELADLITTYVNNYSENVYVQKFTAAEGQVEFIPEVPVKVDSRVELDGRTIYYMDDWTITNGKLEMIIPCTDLQKVVTYSRA